MDRQYSPGKVVAAVKRQPLGSPSPVANMRIQGKWLAAATLAISTLSCSSAAEWPFAEPKQTLVSAELTLFNQHRPILVVVRSVGDGQWMFLADENPLIDLAVSVTLEEIVKLDCSR